MFRKIIKAYYNLFDNKLRNGTLVVILVTLIILGIGFLSKKEQTLSHLKTSLYESYKF